MSEIFNPNYPAKFTQEDVESGRVNSNGTINFNAMNSLSNIVVFESFDLVDDESRTEKLLRVAKLGNDSISFVKVNGSLVPSSKTKIYCEHDVNLNHNSPYKYYESWYVEHLEDLQYTVQYIPVLKKNVTIVENDGRNAVVHLIAMRGSSDDSGEFQRVEIDIIYNADNNRITTLNQSDVDLNIDITAPSIDRITDIRVYFHDDLSFTASFDD